jgi:S-adenosylmethionine:tRNA ribosyltransferase-isomerase
MKLSLFDYKLPKNLIAQKQIKPRDASRLMIINLTSLRLRGAGKKTKKIGHDFFYNLDKYLSENDVLVFNNSKVIPARIKFGQTGEIFLLNELKSGEWEVMGRKLRFKIYDLRFKNILLKCEIIKRLKNGNWLARFNYKGKKFRQILERIGETPTPPYIKTPDSTQKRKDYQTIYAKVEGSVAAPTAGLHFTQRIFGKLKSKGVKCEFVTLHVGLGTFAPVKIDRIEEHRMHSEYAVLDEVTTRRLNNYKKQGKRIVAVGTTSARVLEALANKKGQLKAGSKWVDIFIYPGYKFRFVDALITNFHLPKSTLLMLVSALAGRKFILRVYQEAIKSKYRFYSFGDGMLIY